MLLSVLCIFAIFAQQSCDGAMMNHVDMLKHLTALGDQFDSLNKQYMEYQKASVQSNSSPPKAKDESRPEMAANEPSANGESEEEDAAAGGGGKAPAAGGGGADYMDSESASDEGYESGSDEPKRRRM